MSALPTCGDEAWLSDEECFLCELPAGHEGRHRASGETESTIDTQPGVAWVLEWERATTLSRS
jgi:hypothetical protein